MTWPSLPARNLEPAELQDFVDALARSPEDWRDRLEMADGGRHFVSVHRDDYVDVWLIAWTAAGDTGWHDHDISAGAVRVTAGALQESVLRLGGEPTTRILRAGASFSFGPERIHRLAGLDEHSISIHAYSPPLWRLGQYVFGSDGVMRRTSISYAEELRPIADGLVA